MRRPNETGPRRARVLPLVLLAAALSAAPLAAAPQKSSGGGSAKGDLGEIVPPPPDPPLGGEGDSLGGATVGARPGAAPGGGGGAGSTRAGAGGTAGSGPIGAGPVAPGAPTPRSLAAAQDRSHWWHWWQYHRELYLDLDAALGRLHPRTPAGDDLPEPLPGRRNGLGREVVYGRLVPAIVATLEELDDPRFVRHALLALGRIGEAPPLAGGEGGPELADVIARYLGDRSLAVTEAAVIALGALASPRAAVMLNDLVLDTERGRELTDRRRVPVRVRALAAYGLGVGGAADAPAAVRSYAVHSLAQVLSSDVAVYPDVQAACVVALGMVPAGAGRPAEAGGALPPSSGLEAQVRHVLGLFVDEDQPDMVRTHAPTALARLLAADPGLDPALRDTVVRTLLDALSARANERVGVRRSCIVALGEIADADADALDVEARERLEASVRRGDVPSRNFAIMALARIGGRPGTGEGEPLGAAEDVERFLVAQLTKGKSLIQPWAGLALGVFAHGLREHGELLSARAADALREAIESTKSPEQCAALCLGIGLVGDNRAQATLLARLAAFQDEESLAHVAVALGMLRDGGAAPPLAALTAEALHRPELMESAALGRALLGDRDLVGELVARLAECESEPSARGVCRGLSWSADHRALEALLAVMTDAERSAGIRAHAAEAIGRIADRSPIPWDVRISAGLNYLDAPTTLTDPSGFGILDTF